jgi:hypothetical protein
MMNGSLVVVGSGVGWEWARGQFFPVPKPTINRTFKHRWLIRHIGKRLESLLRIYVGGITLYYERKSVLDNIGSLR